MFIDIDESKWSQKTLDAIKYVTSAGIMMAYEDGSFQPADTVTNAELYRCIYKAFSPYRYTPCDKLDKITSSDHWAVPYACFIKEYAPNILKEINPEDLDRQATTSYKSALIDEFFYFFIPSKDEYPSSEEHANTSNNSIKKEGLTRIELANTFYSKTKDFVNVITFTGKKSKHLPHNLMKHWEKSRFNPFSFALNLKQYLPSIYNDAKDLTFFSLFDYFIDESPENASSLYSYMVDINEMIDNTIPAMTTACQSFYQYTTLSSLYLMLAKSNTARSSEIPKISIHMSNVAYLNDPLEGMCFEKKLYNKLKSLHLLKEYDPSTDSSMDRIINTKDTYIASFIKSSEERLPMWVQYADNAKGCRIEFKTNEKLKLTPVQYRSSAALPVIVKNLIEKASSTSSAKKRKYIFEKIHEIQYFYKDSYYKHENEIRYLSTTPVSAAFSYASPRENEYFPRLYCPIPEPLEIKSVTLGAKCPNPEQVALFLKKKNVPAVYMSKIHYR